MSWLYIFVFKISIICRYIGSIRFNYNSFKLISTYRNKFKGLISNRSLSNSNEFILSELDGDKNTIKENKILLACDPIINLEI